MYRVYQKELARPAGRQPLAPPNRYRLGSFPARFSAVPAALSGGAIVAELAVPTRRSRSRQAPDVPLDRPALARREGRASFDPLNQLVPRLKSAISHPLKPCAGKASGRICQYGLHQSKQLKRFARVEHRSGAVQGDARGLAPGLVAS
jgi:hypothetical protein